jgi:hypothetical protein
MKTFLMLTTLLSTQAFAANYDLICSGRKCSSSPYGSACTNIFVGVDEKGNLRFTNKNSSNSGKFMNMKVTNVSKNFSRGSFTVEAENEKESAVFKMNVYGKDGVRGSFKSSTSRTVKFRCNRNAVINL